MPSTTRMPPAKAWSRKLRSARVTPWPARHRRRCAAGSAQGCAGIDHPPTITADDDALRLAARHPTGHENLEVEFLEKSPRAIAARSRFTPERRIAWSVKIPDNQRSIRRFEHCGGKAERKSTTIIAVSSPRAESIAAEARHEQAHRQLFRKRLFHHICKGSQNPVDGFRLKWQFALARPSDVLCPGTKLPRGQASIEKAAGGRHDPLTCLSKEVRCRRQDGLIGSLGDWLSLTDAVEKLDRLSVEVSCPCC
jgi:hypothetical protein